MHAQGVTGWGDDGGDGVRGDYRNKTGRFILRCRARDILSFLYNLLWKICLHINFYAYCATGRDNFGEGGVSWDVPVRDQEVGLTARCAAIRFAAGWCKLGHCGAGLNG